jgi:hypothetical protein
MISHDRNGQATGQLPDFPPRQSIGLTECAPGSPMIACLRTGARRYCYQAYSIAGGCPGGWAWSKTTQAW